MKPVTAAIVGSGNIGTDLMYKLLRVPELELRTVVGVDPASDGLRRARDAGLEADAGGVDWLLGRDELPDIVFEATSAYAHRANAPRYAEAGIQAVDLTPAAIGPFVCPPVNLPDHIDAENVNLISCGGQATVPMVHAVARVCDVSYAEIVSTVSSRSAGPGTRQNIDSFTATTARAVEVVGGARRGKAVIILNPAEPPILMRNTVFCAIEAEVDRDAVAVSIAEMVTTMQHYVPGFRLTADAQFDDPRPEWEGRQRVTILTEVTGAGDYFPPYAGNLDIITAATTEVGRVLAASRERVAT
jgi:acetaldehyde dehydrogenase